MSSLEDEIRRIVREELAKMQPANDELEQLTVAEYARRWSLSTSTVRQAIRDERLPVTRIGRAVRVAAGATIGPPRTTANDRAVLSLMRGGRVR